MVDIRTAVERRHQDYRHKYKSTMIPPLIATTTTVILPVLFLFFFLASPAHGEDDAALSACVTPPNGCPNGMFKQSTCSCQCIPPFCPVDGNCLATDTTCEDPWVDCEMGVDCPWWVNYLTTDECTTGPVVSFVLIVFICTHTCGMYSLGKHYY